MRERDSRVTLVTRTMYIRMYVYTIKCDINTHGRIGGSLRREMDERETEGDGRRQRAPLGDAGEEGGGFPRRMGGREGGEYERADQSS